MPNRNYVRGVAFEREIVNEARAKGLIAWRSAGSHSPIDCVIWNKANGYVQFIQCKTKKSNKKQGRFISDRLKTFAEIEYYRITKFIR